MQIRFVSQPFDDGDDTRDFLCEVLRDPAIEFVDIAVAWAKRSGLRIVEQDIRTFRARGGKLRIIAGIDEGGATRQGLARIHDSADQAYVYHLGQGRTFHPKVYLAYGARSAAVLVGSQNLTAGGLIRNVEAAAVIRFDPTTTDGLALIASVREGFIEQLIRDTAACRRLDASTLGAILADPAFRVGDEDFPRQGVGGVNQSTSGSGSSLFGATRYKLRSVPTHNTIAADVVDVTSFIINSSTTDASRETSARQGSATSLSQRASGRVVARRWFKRMSAADAQRPNPGTNPTGHLTLTQAGHPIDHRKYFRYMFFGGLDWRPVVSGGAGRVVVTVTADVHINGQPFGRQQLLVDHNPAYEAGQGNRTTTLHWGDVLNDYFRKSSHVGDTITLERLDDDGFRISIEKQPTGPFLK